MKHAPAFGYRPDLPDFRDYRMSFPEESVKTLPAKFNLRPHWVPIVDQMDIGSCVDNAIERVFRFTDKTKPFDGSRLFLYYNARSLEGSVKVDSGSSVRDGFRALTKWGLCHENTWPYKTAKFTQKPPKAAYKDAALELGVTYQRVDQTPQQIKAAVVANHPVVFGFSVYDSFMSDGVAGTGTVPMPSPNESLLGGHCVPICGYDDSKGVYLVPNSWGLGWGDEGWFTLPFDYVHNPDLAADFWILTKAP